MISRPRIGIGSYWAYTGLDRSVYCGQFALILKCHTDALGDQEFDVLLSPSMKRYDIKDCIINRYFTFIAKEVD